MAYSMTSVVKRDFRLQIISPQTLVIPMMPPPDYPPNISLSDDASIFIIIIIIIVIIFIDVVIAGTNVSYRYLIFYWYDVVCPRPFPR